MAHSMLRSGGASTPTTHHDDRPICGRCVRCHPGKNFGGDESCRVPVCKCHRGGA